MENLGVKGLLKLDNSKLNYEEWAKITRNKNVHWWECVDRSKGKFKLEIREEFKREKFQIFVEIK